MPLAIFGISSSGISLVVNLLVLFLVIVYFALVYWTYLDAKRRIEDPVLISCAVAASLFPFIGTIVYTILRPPEFLEDARERELEIRASELRVRELIEGSCPHCEYPIERSFMVCPNCERSLKNPCRSCKKPLDPKWGVCPYCETEVRRQKKQAAPAADTGDDRATRARAERQERAKLRAQRQAREPGGGQRPSGQRPPSPRPATERPGERPTQPGGGGSGEHRPTRPAVHRSEGDSSQRSQWPERP